MQSPVQVLVREISPEEHSTAKRFPKMRRTGGCRVETNWVIQSLTSRSILSYCRSFRRRYVDLKLWVTDTIEKHLKAWMYALNHYAHSYRDWWTLYTRSVASN